MKFSTIGVLGATGMLGEPVARALRLSGFQVTILARDTAKAARKFPDFDIRYADVFNLGSLYDSFSQIDALYVNLSVSSELNKRAPIPEREGLDNILKAARSEGLKQIGMISSLVQQYQGTNGYDWWVFDLKNQAVEKVLNFPVPSFIFRPSTFMEALAFQFRRGNQLLLAGESKQKMYLVAAQDYARQVVQAFTTFGGEDRTWEIQGEKAYTLDEAYEVMMKYSKPRLRVLKLPMGLIKTMSYLNGSMNYLWHIVEAMNNFEETFQAEQTWNDLGKPSITLQEYASRIDA